MLNLSGLLLIHYHDGASILIPRSKTETEGKGIEIVIPHGSRVEACAVRSQRAWISIGGIDAEPVFQGIFKHDVMFPGRMHDRGVARPVKRTCDLIGLDSRSLWGIVLGADWQQMLRIRGVLLLPLPRGEDGKVLR